MTYQPAGYVFPNAAYLNSTIAGASTNDNGIVNGTIFVALPVTPFNLSLINPHVVAGPSIYQAD